LYGKGDTPDGADDGAAHDGDDHPSAIVPAGRESGTSSAVRTLQTPSTASMVPPAPADMPSS
jgi:hypothetical protein